MTGRAARSTSPQINQLDRDEFGEKDLQFDLAVPLTLFSNCHLHRSRLHSSKRVPEFLILKVRSHTRSKIISVIMTLPSVVLLGDAEIIKRYKRGLQYMALTK